jgi:competence protein ComEC
MRQYPAIGIALFYTLGIILARSGWATPLLSIMLTVFGLSTLLLLRKNFLLMLLISSLVLGLANTSAHLYINDQDRRILLQNDRPLAGTIENIKQKNNSLLLLVKLKRPAVRLNLLVKGRKAPGLSIGQDLTVTPPFEWQDTASQAKIMFLPVTSEQVSFGERHFSLSVLLNTINRACLNIHNKSLPPPYDALLTGLVFGNGITELPEDINNAYMRTGVIHLLVVSGAQVALLLTIFTRLCAAFRLSGTATFLASSFFNFFFVLLTGAGPSISRAGLMAEFALLARFSGRGQHFYTTLSLSALLLLLLDPLYLFHIGFQLSFLATFALFYLAPILEDWLRPHFGRFSAPLGVSLAPLILSTPLIAFYFNRISLIALPANIFVAVLIEILVVAGFTATVFGLIGLFPLALILNHGNYLVMLLLNKAIFLLADLPLAQLNIASLPIIFLLVFYVLIFLAGEKLKKRTLTGRQVVTGILLLATLVLASRGYSGHLGNALPLQITAMDVGQGDALLIETPRHKRILIDGGSFIKGDRSVFQFLAKKGINTLDGVILTHAHSDHLNGILPVIENINTRWIMVSGFQNNTVNYKKFLYMIKKKKIPLHIAIRGSSISPEKDLVLRILNPSRPFLQKTVSDDNENSVVCRLVYKNFSMLFAGDAGIVAEKTLLDTQLPLSSTVLKTGHHGSRWASTAFFLSVVEPQSVIVCCGAGNKFGHPHKEFLERLVHLRQIRQRDIPLYRTDLRGNILISSDGYKYIIRGNQ